MVGWPFSSGVGIAQDCRRDFLAAGTNPGYRANRDIPANRGQDETHEPPITRSRLFLRLGRVGQQPRSQRSGQGLQPRCRMHDA